jgi:hypothetical protein
MLKYFLDFCCEKKNERFFFFTILRYAAMTFLLKNNIKKTRPCMILKDNFNETMTAHLLWQTMTPHLLP